MSIVTAEQAETAIAADYSRGGMLAAWVSTGLGRGGDLSEDSSVNFEVLEDPDLEDRLAVGYGKAQIPSSICLETTSPPVVELISARWTSRPWLAT